MHELRVDGSCRMWVPDHTCARGERNMPLDAVRIKHTDTHTHTHAHTHTRAHAPHTHMHVHTYTHAYKRTHTHIVVEGVMITWGWVMVTYKHGMVTYKGGPVWLWEWVMARVTVRDWVMSCTNEVWAVWLWDWGIPCVTMGLSHVTCEQSVIRVTVIEALHVWRSHIST